MASNSTPKTHEETASDAFTKKMNQTVFGAFTTLSMALGVKLGLFEVMASLDQPITSADIADRANCKERYVREWLNHMVVSDIITVDDSGTKYLLPEDHREGVTSPATMLLQMGKILPYLSIPHDEVMECFTKDGPQGLPFDEVKRAFEEIRGTGQMPMLAAESFLQLYVERVDGMAQKLGDGASICDLGCGLGHLCSELGRRFPKSNITGVDMCESFIQNAQESKLSNVTFEVQDITSLPASWTNKFDYINMAKVLHDVSQPRDVLAEVRRCLKPGGILQVVEPNFTSNIAKSLEDPVLKANGQFYFPWSMYHCLPSAMNEEGSTTLGSCIGTEKLVIFIQQSGFKLQKQGLHPPRSTFMLFQ